MNEILVISNILLWILVIGLSVLVLALARQVGILHERVAPAGALTPTTGPKVGELTTALAVEDLEGATLTIGGDQAAERPDLLLFISPTCPVCRTLVPTARSLAHREGFRLIFASDGDTPDRHLAYTKDLGIEDYPYVISQTLGVSYAVSKLPFAVLIGRDGILKSKGLVNTREHLESLVEAMDTGIATLQDYVKQYDPGDRNQTTTEERTS